MENNTKKTTLHLLFYIHRSQKEISYLTTSLETIIHVSCVRSKTSLSSHTFKTQSQKTAKLPRTEMKLQQKTFL